MREIYELNRMNLSLKEGDKYRIDINGESYTVRLKKYDDPNQPGVLNAQFWWAVSDDGVQIPGWHRFASENHSGEVLGRREKSVFKSMDELGMLTGPSLKNVIKSKAMNATIRRIYENKTGTSASPGNGPAKLIREFAGVKVPKGAEGGSKKTRRKTRKMRRKA